MKLGIMAGMVQKGSYALGSGTYKAGIAGDSSQAHVARHHDRFDSGVQGLEEYM